jgi:hypothetical protein
MGSISFNCSADSPSLPFGEGKTTDAIHNMQKKKCMESSPMAFSRFCGTEKVAVSNSTYITTSVKIFVNCMLFLPPDI